MTRLVLFVVCKKKTTTTTTTTKNYYCLSTNKKLLVIRQFSGPYGVTKHGSGWWKDVVNQRLEFGARHVLRTQAASSSITARNDNPQPREGTTAARVPHDVIMTKTTYYLQAMALMSRLCSVLDVWNPSYQFCANILQLLQSDYWHRSTFPHCTRTDKL